MHLIFNWVHYSITVIFQITHEGCDSHCDFVNIYTEDTNLKYKLFILYLKIFFFFYIMDEFFWNLQRRCKINPLLPDEKISSRSVKILI